MKINKKSVQNRLREEDTLNKDVSNNEYYYNNLGTVERKILLLVAMGHNNCAVGKQLGMSSHTVKFHLRLILQKLQARNRAHATYLALKYKVIQ